MFKAVALNFRHNGNYRKIKNSDDETSRWFAELIPTGLQVRLSHISRHPNDKCNEALFSFYESQGISREEVREVADMMPHSWWIPISKNEVPRHLNHKKRGRKND